MPSHVKAGTFTPFYKDTYKPHDHLPVQPGSFIEVSKQPNADCSRRKRGGSLFKGLKRFVSGHCHFLKLYFFWCLLQVYSIHRRSGSNEIVRDTDVVRPPSSLIGRRAKRKCWRDGRTSPPPRVPLNDTVLFNRAYFIKLTEIFISDIGIDRRKERRMVRDKERRTIKFTQTLIN